MNRSSKGIKLVFASQRTDNITPDVLVKSFWVSTALALILALPALGVFIAVFQSSGNMLIGSIVGFCIHFVILSKSEKISTALTSLFDD
jgi:Mg/Co/Ni transporter MgtE